MKYALICSPGGSGLKQAVEDRLVPFLKDKENLVIQHVDVEDVLCGSYAVRRSLEGMPLTRAPNMGEVTRNVPRTDVIRMWKQALRESITTLNYRALGQHGLPQADLSILTCHLDLYGGRWRELYSPLDLRALVEDGHEVTHVLLLIDDIFDMYYRLSRPGFLYDEDASVIAYVAERRKEQAGAPPMSKAKQLAAVEAIWPFEWKSNVLFALLAWRRAEMLMAEAVAHQLNARYLVYSLKQGVGPVAHWLTSPERFTVYVSHPISRPREERRKGAWPKDNVVEGCNSLPASLDPLGISCVMPTGIDELRFQPDAAKSPLPILEPRWPIPTVETLYTLPDQINPEPEHTRMFLSNHKYLNENWGPRLRPLINVIGAEVAFRDHHLVVATDGLLVFRPFYGDGKTSRGVAAEVEHWRSLAKSDPKRRAAFVHFRKDVALVLAEVAKLPASAGGLDYQIFATLVAELESQGYIRPGMAQRIIQKLLLDSSFESLLDTGVVPPDVQSKLKSNLQTLVRQAELRIIGEQLTLISMPEVPSGIWVIDSDKELPSCMKGVADFLSSSTAPPPTEWQEAGLASMQDVRTSPQPTVRRPKSTARRR
jgi:hypothetical protein